MSKTVIKVENLSKLYRLGVWGGATLRDEIARWWAKKTGKSVAEKDNPIVYVTVTVLKPVRSRIEKLKLEMAV